MNLLAWVVKQTGGSHNATTREDAPPVQEKPTMPEEDDGRQRDSGTQTDAGTQTGQSPSGPEETLPSGMIDAETLLFVDADGVVNVGIRDTPGQSPLLLCESNLARCRQSTGSASQIITSAAGRSIGHGDDGTYSKFATRSGSSDICPLFAQRMAEIIRHAGPKCVMVLSSSWRKASHQSRVAALEAQLTEYSGQPVGFGHRTRPGGDEPEKRLQLIGDFVHEYSQSRSPSQGPLRVLVLEDFAATHPRQWKFADCIRSKRAIEEFWRSRSTTPNQTAVKLIHTYDEWKTDSGLQVQIGSGLTNARVTEARRWLLGQAPDESLNDGVARI